jgi:hypothetical protein
MIQQTFTFGVEAEFGFIERTELPAGPVFGGVKEDVFIPEGEKIRTFPHLAAGHWIGKGLSVPYSLR